MTSSSKCTAPVCSNSAKTAKMPGVRCPNCLAQGKEIWVIPGKNCHICHTPCA
ncbi:Pc20g06180 [Penicillium rubens Wisconsin 54-1255]|uniref:Pc20g06180 protein n=1 Tax=Penicillium rubens (strain ATCC 28089 / DSM 1075 / NRRL 1951 / Wisconsin 54-1255) TaxID=500485 RepID=B6HG39_PENRW|nr:Pc20g06180 [Penicillium rubens Wisconsin 54-1255]